MKDIKERAKSWWMQNTANFITIVGLFTSSWLLLEIIFNPQNLFRITILYILSGISDFLDGKVAHWLKIESPLGSVADQFRDKVLFCPSQVLLVIQYWQRFHISFLALMLAFVVLELLTFFGGLIGIFWNLKGVKKIKTDSSNWGRKKTFAGFIVGLLIILYIGFKSPIIQIPALSVAYFGLLLIVYWSLKNLAEYKARAWPENGGKNKAQ